MKGKIIYIIHLCLVSSQVSHAHIINFMTSLMIYSKCPNLDCAHVADGIMESTLPIVWCYY